MTAMTSTPENIIELKPNEVFVFGSNLSGQHVGGAAALAFEKFGAEWGVGVGLCGQCYAFPTLGTGFGKLTKSLLERARDDFFQVAELFSGKTFLLTRVGCGIAGYPEEDMKALFADAPPNVVKPEGW